jgi:hypothetical protein
MNFKTFRSLITLNFLVILLAFFSLCAGGVLLFKVDSPISAPPEFEERLAARVGQEYSRDTHNSVIRLSKNSDRIAVSSFEVLNACGRIGIFLGVLLLCAGIVSSVILWRAYTMQNRQNKPAHPTAGNA